MSIVKVKKHSHNFVMLDITCLSDTRLSFKAKGLHAYLIAKPDDWEIAIRQLEQQSPKEGREAIASGLQELLYYGYATRKRVRTGKGTIQGWETIVYEQPLTEVGSTEVGSTEVGSTEVGSTEVGQPVITKDCLYPGLSLPRIKRQENSLTSFESFAGDETALIPSPSVPPPTKRAPLKKKPLAVDDWLAVWLQQQDLLDIPFAFLNDDKWWEAASILVTDGLNESWLERQFAKIVLHFQKPGESQPRTEAGWKRFLTHWFQLADKIEQREKRQEKRYGSQTKTWG